MIIFGRNAEAAITLQRKTKTERIMKKSIIILAIATVAASTVWGRVVRRQLSIIPNSVPETETLGNETMEFVYEYTYLVDTAGILSENTVSDNMLLQIGPNGLSKFSSLKNLTIDSIVLRSTSEQIFKAACDGKLETGEFMTVYKNYPDGMLTNADKICMDWFSYTEDIPQFDWQLTDSTCTILGYECQSAKCTFRGREWIAFYAEDIPLTDGPWKLHGLPGLIMKAADSTGEYAFECIGIKSKADRPITMYKVPYNKVNRHDYYDAKHRYEVNPYAYYQTTTGGTITVSDENGNPVHDAYDPMELPYDYIERDWKK